MRAPRQTREQFDLAPLLDGMERETPSGELSYMMDTNGHIRLSQFGSEDICLDTVEVDELFVVLREHRRRRGITSECCKAIDDLRYELRNVEIEAVKRKPRA